MSDSNKKKLPVYTTEIGEAVYPHLTKADTRFNADGLFHTKVKFDGDTNLTKKVGKEVTPGGTMLDLLGKEHEAAIKIGKKKHAEAMKGKKSKKQMKIADLPLEENEDGTVVYNFKMRHHIKTKSGDEWFQTPKIFDAKGQLFKPKSGIFSGSKLKVAFTIHPFYTAQVGAGVTLRLRAVQVVDLVEGQGVSAESYGFDEEEGYEAPDSNPFEEEEESNTGVDPDGDDDGPDATAF